MFASFNVVKKSIRIARRERLEEKEAYLDVYISEEKNWKQFEDC
jgi:hypothetical protein